MGLLNSILTWVMKKRMHDIELFMKYPLEVQGELFTSLMEKGRFSEFGEKYEFSSIKSLDDYKARVPIQSYEDIFPYIERIMRGEQQVLWPTDITWFAKSSGTTSIVTVALGLQNSMGVQPS